MGLREEALELHKIHRGKVAISSKVKVENAKDLSLAYSPGVAEPCKEIYQQPDLVFEYTNRGNMVAIVSDGTAVLGLGDIGPAAALPVMEGKAILLREFAGVDAFPICLDTKDVDHIVQTVRFLEPTFGGINLEDISGPRCFEVEERLQALMQIPVFHDDQHGTAVVVCAGLSNAVKVVGKELAQIRVIVNGAGAAGIAITKMLITIGVTPAHISLCDKSGRLVAGGNGSNKHQEEMARLTNPQGVSGSLPDVCKNADVFVGVSAPNIVTPEMVKTMAPDSIIFGMANPVPEIMPDLALAAGAAIVGSGRSDLPNQINNILGFPGIFRGALDVRATRINEAMKLAAVKAIAGLIAPDELALDYVIPKPFDKRVVPAVALAVAQAAMDTGVARDPKSLEELKAGLVIRGLIS